MHERNSAQRTTRFNVVGALRPFSGINPAEKASEKQMLKNDTINPPEMQAFFYNLKKLSNARYAM